MTKRHATGYWAAVAIVLSLVRSLPAAGQFIDRFAGGLELDPSGLNGWSYKTGDGNAVMQFVDSHKGYASIVVDARSDRLGIWWALIKRCVSRKMDLNLVKSSRCELRVEACIRVSDAPKRINLSLNAQRTTDFHSNLMEYEIPDTVNWHTISMTTHDFDAATGDTVYGQVALMDWGFRQYRVDVKYFRVDVMARDLSGRDLGVQVPYHPAVPAIETFSMHLPAVESAVVDTEFSDMFFANWCTMVHAVRIHVLAVDADRFIILRWDLTKYKGRKIHGSGLLELTTQSLQRSSDYQKDFGIVRVTELVGGKQDWKSNTVTADEIRDGKPFESIYNSQMIIDVDVDPCDSAKNLITISNPVLQRMLDGESPGLIVDRWVLSAQHSTRTEISFRNCTLISSAKRADRKQSE